MEIATTAVTDTQLLEYSFHSLTLYLGIYDAILAFHFTVLSRYDVVSACIRFSLDVKILFPFISCSQSPVVWRIKTIQNKSYTHQSNHYRRKRSRMEIKWTNDLYTNYNVLSNCADRHIRIRCDFIECNSWKKRNAILDELNNNSNMNKFLFAGRTILLFLCKLFTFSSAFLFRFFLPGFILL